MAFRQWGRRGAFKGNARAIAAGYRSGLEEGVAKQLAALSVSADYEKHVIEFVQPEKKRKYTPDFVLPNRIIIETKGMFTSEDRQKHVWIKKQHPYLDIRFVFSNPKAKLNKTSTTTYGDWCEKNGFLYATRLIPQSWINEKGPTYVRA